MQPLPMVLLSKVAAPVFAKALPQVIVAPASRVMLVLARMFPSNSVSAPRVAELPTIQYAAEPVPTSDRTTSAVPVVMSVDGIRKTQASLALPLPLRVSVPDKFPPALAAIAATE